MSDPSHRVNINPYWSLLYGGIAGCVAKTAIAPFDRVKIHFQIAHPELKEYRGKMSGVFGAVKQIYTRSGILGLYKGHSATLARILPYAAINFAAFEKFKTILHTQQESDRLPWRKLLAGSLAGTLAVSVTYPFDIIRARITYDLAHKDNYPGPAKNIFKTIIFQLSRESNHPQTKFPLKGFYQGFLPTILGIIPYAGVSFSVFECLKQKLQKFNGSDNVPSFQIFVSGLIAGALGQTVAYPLDVVRRRMQLYRLTDHLPAHHYNSGIITAIKSIVTSHGWARGVFSGLSINYLKVAPASGISFLVYETLKKKFPEGLI